MKKTDSAPTERTKDFRRRLNELKLEAALKKRDARQQQLKERGY